LLYQEEPVLRTGEVVKIPPFVLPGGLIGLATLLMGNEIGISVGDTPMTPKENGLTFRRDLVEILGENILKEIALSRFGVPSF